MTGFDGFVQQNLRARVSSAVNPMRAASPLLFCQTTGICRLDWTEHFLGYQKWVLSDVAGLWLASIEAEGFSTCALHYFVHACGPSSRRASVGATQPQSSREARWPVVKKLVHYFVQQKGLIRN